jgi:spore coat protein U-like protein
MKKIKLLAGLIALLTLNIGNASTASAPMQVTATVAPKCTVVAPNITFGTVQMGSSGMPVFGVINIECTKGTAFSVAFDGGLNGVFSPNRRMKHASLNEYLEYSLSVGGQDTPFNQTNNSGVGDGIGSPVNMLVNANVNTNANVSAGNYSDSVTVTVTY